MADAITTRIGYVKGAKGDTGEKGAKGDPGGLVASGDGTVYNSTTGAVDLAPEIKNKLSNFDDTTNKLKDSALSDNVTNKLSAIELAYENGYASINLFAKEDITKGYYLQADGTMITNSSWAYSGYIPILPNENYILSGISGSAPSVCWYDANKGFISGSFYNEQTTKTVSTPANARYIRISVAISNLNIFQIEKGTSASDYQVGAKSNKQLTEEISTVNVLTNETYYATNTEHTISLPNGYNDTNCVVNSIYIKEVGTQQYRLATQGCYSEISRVVCYLVGNSIKLTIFSSINGYYVKFLLTKVN